MKRLFAIFAATLLLASPALARTDWAKYKTFTNTRCENSKTVADMIETAKEFPIFHDLSRLKVLESKTVRATANTLACRVRLTVVYRGGNMFARGLYTIHIFPNGQWNANFDQTY